MLISKLLLLLLIVLLILLKVVYSLPQKVELGTLGADISRLNVFASMSEAVTLLFYRLSNQQREKSLRI